MAEAWKILEEESSSSSSAPSSTPAGGGPSVSGRALAGANSGKSGSASAGVASTGAAGGKRKRSEAAEGSRAPKSAKKGNEELAQVLAETSKVKQLYPKVVMRGESLVGQIDTAQAWA